MLKLSDIFTDCTVACAHSERLLLQIKVELPHHHTFDTPPGLQDAVIFRF